MISNTILGSHAILGALVFLTSDTPGPSFVAHIPKYDPKLGRGAFREAIPRQQFTVPEPSVSEAIPREPLLRAAAERSINQGACPSASVGHPVGRPGRRWAPTRPRQRRFFQEAHCKQSASPYRSGDSRPARAAGGRPQHGPVPAGPDRVGCSRSADGQQQARLPPFGLCRTVTGVNKMNRSTVGRSTAPRGR